jgi:hypothetical protein
VSTHVRSLGVEVELELTFLLSSLGVKASWLSTRSPSTPWEGANRRGSRSSQVRLSSDFYPWDPDR